MKTSKLYIYLLIITVLIININAHIIPVYQYKKIIKRDDTTTDNTNDTGDNQNVTQPDNNQDTPPDNSAQTTKAPEVTPQPQVVPTTTQPQSQPTPTTEKTPEKTPDKTPEDETKNQETIGIKTATKDSETKTSGINSTSTNKSDNNNKNNNNNNNKSNDNEDDDDGLSGGTIALIVVGGIFALGVVIIIFRSLLKLCTKKSKDYPTPVLNVVSNQESSEQLNPQMKISQDPMLESGYYNQSTSTIPATGTGTVVGVNDNSQYYPPQQPMYDNGGVDISNQYQQDMNNQYQQDEYQNGYTDDYPVQPQSEVVQPIRNFSSLRRQNLTSGMPEMPLEGYDNPSMMNGEITDVPQAPHKVIINKTNNTPIEPNTIHKAQFPFNPNMSDELKLNTGDAVEIIEVYDDGWSYGKNMATNEIGVFPISYITGYNDPSNNF